VRGGACASHSHRFAFIPSDFRDPSLKVADEVWIATASLKLRDLIKDALEAQQDIVLAEVRRGSGKDLSADSGAKP